MDGWRRRTGEENPQAIESYLRSLAKANDYDDLFELGRTFGLTVQSFNRAHSSLWNAIVEPPPPSEQSEFRLVDFVDVKLLDKLCRQLDDFLPTDADDAVRTRDTFLFAKDMVCEIHKHCNRNYGLYPESHARACELVADITAAVWQAFGVVLGAIRKEDVAARRREGNRRIARELMLGGQITDDRMQQSLRIAQDLVRQQSCAPAVVVSQLAFAVEACMKRVLGGQLAYQDAKTVLLTQQRSKDERMKKFASVAYALREVYRHDATHKSDDLEVSWAEATFFVMGVHVLYEL